MPLDPQIAGLLQFLESSGAPPMYEVSPDEARRMFRALSCDAVQPDQVVPVGSVEDVSVPGGDGDRPARVYRPEGDGDVPTLVYLHGGGFVIGDLDTHDQTCRRICRDAGVVVVSVDYRLAPEHPFPAGVEDAVAAVRWAAEEKASLGGSDVLAVGGDSAGGNLAAVAAQELPDLVDAQLLIYPKVDSAEEHPSVAENGAGYFLDKPTMDWFGINYVGDTPGIDPRDPRLSPYHASSLEGLPPALVATAEFDPLRDEGEAYADRLAEAGVRVEKVRYDGLIHGFVDMGPWSEAAAAAITDMNARFKDLLA